MVTVFLRGGLGNQMFQYAAGLSVALQNKTTLSLDTTFLSDRFPRKEFTYRTFDLDIFKGMENAKLTKLSRIASMVPIPGVWLGIDLALIKVNDLLGIQKVVQEGDRLEGEDLFLWGRWQSEKYFAQNEAAIRDAFQFKYPLEGEAANIAADIAKTNSVSLHIRRGDYIAFKSMEKLMGGTDLAYYDRAIAHVRANVENPKFFIFSDDIAWCRKYAALPEGSVYLGQASAGPNASFHLALMSLCKHNIIANSTFSWWGAWLNANPEKIVIAPKQWTANGEQEDEDIIPVGSFTL